jgi:tetratricopeptide (TPR) repeat protein
MPRSIARPCLPFLLTCLTAVGIAGCSGSSTVATGEPDSSVASSADAPPAADVVNAQREAGSELLAAGHYEQAVEEFTRALKASGANVGQAVVDNSTSSLYQQRGVAYLRMGFPDTAKEDFTDAINLAPNDATAYEQRAIAYLELGDLFNALRDATQAIRLKPHNAGAYQTRGVVYSRREQYDRAVADLEQAIVEDPALTAVVTPELGEAYFRWSERLANDGVETAAAEKLARAEELAPDFVREQKQLATADVEVEVVEQVVAKPVINEAIERLNRGRQLQIAGQNDQALIEFTESIALDREQPEPYLRRGETLLALNFPDTALEDFKSAEERGGPRAELHRLQARTYLALDSPHRAAMSATDALHDNPTDASMYALRGEAYLKMENWDRAIADLEEAIRRDPKLEASLHPSLNAAHEGRQDAIARRTQTAYTISEQ